MGKFIPGMIVKIKDLSNENLINDKMKSCSGRLGMVYSSRCNDACSKYEYDLVTINIDMIENFWWPQNYLILADNQEITDYFISSNCSREEIDEYLQCIYD